MPRGKKTKTKSKNGNGSQTTLPIVATAEERMEINQLESWLWDAACQIRGATDAPKFKDFILPLVFYKRLSDVYDDEVSKITDQFGDEALAREIVEADHEDALAEDRDPIVRFFVPASYSWSNIRNHAADGKLGEFVTEALRAVAKLNPKLKGVLDVKDYNERQQGQRVLDDERLSSLIEVLSRHRLGLKNTEPDILGRAYEYLLRKFAEGAGQSAGEFFTPKEVGWMMAEVLDPGPYAKVADLTCGSAGLLIKCRLRFEHQHPELKSKAPRLYGQEFYGVTLAMAKMNCFLHDFTASRFALGDALKTPGFRNGKGLLHFDHVVANPMWNQKGYNEDFYDQDAFGRFDEEDFPPSNTADWGWVQHYLAVLNERGRAAIVLDTGAVTRGSGSKNKDREKSLRAKLVEADVVEGVVLLPDNLFYNTNAPGIVLFLNRAKPSKRKGKFLLVNASQYFVKERPKNRLTDEGIAAVAEAFKTWRNQEKLCRVVNLDEVRAADYNLSPSQFVDVGERGTHRGLSDILEDLKAARQRREEADLKLEEVLQSLGLAS